VFEIVRIYILGDVFLSDLSHLAIDEADTMFDPSFVSMAVEILKYAGVCSF
jgi:superfamily II DNA/RNA helicase